MEPLTAEELAALRAISTPTICNAIETFDVRRRSEVHGLNDHLPFSRAWPGYRLCCHSEDQRGRTAWRRDAACGSLGRVRSYTEALAGRNRGPRVPESGRLLLGRGECRRVQGARCRRDRDEWRRARPA